VTVDDLKGLTPGRRLLRRGGVVFKVIEKVGPDLQIRAVGSAWPWTVYLNPGKPDELALFTVLKGDSDDGE